jgi:hypothetical protein
MDVILAPLALLYLLLVGPFIALNAYLLVWLCGPAIRRAGKCWEEGRRRAGTEQSQFAPWGYVRDPQSQPQAFGKQDPTSPADKEALKDSARRYDAGHRFLG